MRLSAGAVIPELPHSSQWRQGEALTAKSVKDLEPGTAIATFEGGRYGNARHGNHAGIFLNDEPENGEPGIHVLDQFVGRHRDPGDVKVRFYPFEPTPDSHYLAGEFAVIQ